jgi:hypothetical protein
MITTSRGDPDVAASLLEAAAARHGILCRSELHAIGWTDARIARYRQGGSLVRLAPGVYRVGGAPATTESEVLGAVLVHGAYTIASHRTAAWLWGLPGFGRPGRIELMRRSATNNHRAGVIIHRTKNLASHHHAVVRGVPVTSLPRTLFDLAGSVAPAHVERAVEAALRMPHCTIGALHRILAELGRRGREGTTTMRSILADRDHAYAATESELDLIGRAVVAPIAGIEWQVEMADDRGYIRRVDGLHRVGRLVIEWDGAAFHDTPRQRQLDDAGDARLRALGLDVVRFGWHDVTAAPEAVRAEVARRLRPAPAPYRA